MREVVERLTCDVSGETGYSDHKEDGVVIETINWSFGKSSYELDVCAACIDKMHAHSLYDLIGISRDVKGQPKPKTKHVSVGSGRHAGELTNIASLGTGDYGCPACSYKSGTIRGIKMHWANQKRESK